MEHSSGLGVKLAPVAAELRTAGAQPRVSLLPDSSVSPTTPPKLRCLSCFPTHMKTAGLAGIG